MQMIKGKGKTLYSKNFVFNKKPDCMGVMHIFKGGCSPRVFFLVRDHLEKTVNVD